MTNDAPSDLVPTTAFLMYSVFRAATPLPFGDDRAALADQLLAELEQIDELTIRGWYDVSGYRADADIMVWWWGPNPDALQQAYHAVLASELGNHLIPVWSQMGTHRQAEFNAAHIPSFLEGRDPERYLCIYPFVRSYDWYLLPDEERSTMLRDHGMAAKDYKDVLPNTVASFGLGDYEWLLGFEASDLNRIVDLIRTLRDTKARRHVRLETPFYTGQRAPLGEILSRLP